MKVLIKSKTLGSGVGAECWVPKKATLSTDGLGILMTYDVYKDKASKIANLKPVEKDVTKKFKTWASLAQFSLTEDVVQNIMCTVMSQEEGFENSTIEETVVEEPEEPIV